MEPSLFTPSELAGTGATSNTILAALDDKLHSKEMTGTVARVKQFWPSNDGESGTALVQLQSGATVKAIVPDDAALQEDLSYRFLGRWVDHPRYGPQFVAHAFVRELEHSERGIVNYLSKVAEGIGPAKARLLWQRYQADAVAILTTSPERVAEDGVLSLERATEAAASLRLDAKHQAVKIDLAGLFQGRGFPGKLVDAVMGKWGIQAPRIIHDDPFRLLSADMPGCGFIRTDKLHMDLGHNPAALKRVGMCVWDQVSQATQRGHTWHPGGRVQDEVRRRIGELFAVDMGKAVRLMIRAGWLYERWEDGTGYLAERAGAIAERLLARRVVQLLAAPPRWPAVSTDELKPDQIAVLQVILKHSFAVLLGTPGTGKSWLSARIVQAIISAHGSSAVAVCAPTGKAAVRMTQAMKEAGLTGMSAKTVHSLLGVIGNTKRDGWRFTHTEDNPLPYRFVVVDEVSMLDVSLAASLMAACGPTTNILWVGDPYQLPPVGHGAPLRDIIASVPNITGELTVIKRNAGLIVSACRQVKDGERFTTCAAIDLPGGQNLRMVEVADADRVGETIQRIYSRWLDRKTLPGAVEPAVEGGGYEDMPLDPVWDVQILCATNKRRKELNELLQQLVNPGGQKMAARPFRVADKVMCLSNGKFSRADRAIRGPTEYYIANGDMGEVIELHERQMVVRMRTPERLIRVPMGPPANGTADGGTDETESTKDRGAGCDFALAYCCTCHKYQGSECPVVVIVAEKAAGLVASREWHYTAISRGKKLVVLVGQKEVVEQQCKRVAIRDRKTFLQEMIQAGVKAGEMQRTKEEVDLARSSLANAPDEISTPSISFCKTCGSNENTITEQVFCDDTTHRRCCCTACGRFLRYMPREDRSEL